MGGRRAARRGVESTTLELSGFYRNIIHRISAILSYTYIYVLPKEAVLKFLVKPYGLAM